jgi:hypothetical protein
MILKRNPYLFINGPNNDKSAGNQILYKLCKDVENLGYSSYIYPYPFYIRNSFNNNFKCKIANNDLIENFYKKKYNPIIVYPENLKGSKIGGNIRVRFYLYFPGFWGGNKSDNDHYRIAFDKTIKKKIKQRCNLILTIPIINTKIFNKIGAKKKRSFSCYYSEEYENYGGRVKKEIKENIQITKNAYPKMNKSDVAKIFKKSEFFYVYFNTGLIWEAALCGCVPVLMQNKYLKSSNVIYANEFGFAGVAIKNNQILKAKALKKIKLTSKFYKKIKTAYNQKLKKFINDTQNLSFKNNNNNLRIQPIVKFPNQKTLAWMLTILYIIKIEGVSKILFFLRKKSILLINKLRFILKLGDNKKK